MPSATSETEPMIRLPVRLGHAEAQALRPEIEAQRDQPLCLHAGEVEFLGAAGVELLLAARAEWRGKGIAFSLDAPSDGFLGGLDRLGLPHSALIEEESA